MKKKFSYIVVFLLMFFNCSFGISLDDKIGQMIIIGFDGNSYKTKGFKRVQKEIKKGNVSGVILFNKNISTKEDLIKMNEILLSSNDTTPFIAIDNEGGMIQRYNFRKHASASEVANFSEKEAGIHYNSMAKFEKELKINFNFAPCVDLAINKDSIIVKKQRSFSSDPDTVSKYAEIFVKEHNKNHIITSIKHFPGHGSVKGDTHKGFVDSTKSFKKEELKPYYALKDYDKMNTVMVSHIFNSEFDPDYPASLSEKTIKGILKEEIGFKGVIVSDDFDMGAIKKNYSLRETLIRAINSGIDIMIFSNNIDNFDKNISKKIHKIVKQEIKKGNIKEEDIDNSYRKVMALKAQL